MGEFNADDYEIEVNEDGIIIEKSKPGHEPDDNYEDEAVVF